MPLLFHLPPTEPGEFFSRAAYAGVGMVAEDDVDDFIEQFTLAQCELLKGNPEPA
jgi:hypothetical protein